MRPEATIKDVYLIAYILMQPRGKVELRPTVESYKVEKKAAKWGVPNHIYPVEWFRTYCKKKSGPQENKLFSLKGKA